LPRHEISPLLTDPGSSQFNLNVSDVAAMMNACPFDSFRLQRPSPWCSIFTDEEWLGYNYAYDLNQFGERNCADAGWTN
jgi:hypothetical protein